MESTTEIRKSKRRNSSERWKLQNREYYLEQKRVLSHRPEYLAHRRSLYKMKQLERSKNLEQILSTKKDTLKNEFEKTNRGSDLGAHCGQSPGHGASLWDWVGSNWWTKEKHACGSSRSDDPVRWILLCKNRTHTTEEVRLHTGASEKGSWFDHLSLGWY